jgi:hypothetical protein
MRLTMDVILRRALRIAPAFVWRPMMRPWSAVRATVTVVKEAGVEKTAMVTGTACLLPDRGKAVAVQRDRGMWTDVTPRRITVRLRGIHRRQVRPESVHRIV